MKKILSLTFIALLSNLIFGQINPKKCITTNLVKEELDRNSEYELMRQNLINYRLENKDINQKNQSTIIIPVVVHVIHRISHQNIGTGTNISDEQIKDQLKILNEDYSKTNPEFPNPPRNTFVNYAGNPELQFCLATIDPNGNPTTGITRTASSRTSWNADDNTDADAMKRAASGGIDNWDPLRYLNIWVCNLSNSGGGQTLGYAYLPGLQATNQAWKDGLVVDYQYFGTIGTANSSDGRTATHEIGHYLGLEHTFCESGGCCDNDNSNWWGTNVDDTPACRGGNDIYFGSVNSSTMNNTCNDLSYSNIFNSNVLDMDENYMSYAANTWMFSNGQVDAMLGTLNASTWQGGRANLKNSNVTVNCITSSNNNLLSNIKLSIYPNPSKGNLYITSSIEVNTISVYNLIGKKVISNTKISNDKIDINQLENGVYFINISTIQGNISKKFILSR